MDYLLDDNGKMLIQNGDYVIGNSDSQEIALILKSKPGDWKESPFVGCSISTLVKSRSTETKIKKVINEQLANDGFKNISIAIDYPEMTVDAIR